MDRHHEAQSVGLPLSTISSRDDLEDEISSLGGGSLRSVSNYKTDKAGTYASIGIPAMAHEPNLYGLKYLDLSLCRLSDSSCSEILKAAISIHSPIQGLEFEGNTVGQKFMDTFDGVVSQSYCRLQHIGLSNTGLSDKHFYSLLHMLTANTSIYSINVAHNSLNHTSQTKEAFKLCLRGNKTLRFLDLSFNRFTVDTAKAVHMAVLENETLNILRLIGNNACTASEYRLLQEKLQKNRKRTNAGAREGTVPVEENWFEGHDPMHDFGESGEEQTGGGDANELPEAVATLSTAEYATAEYAKVELALIPTHNP